MQFFKYSLPFLAFVCAGLLPRPAHGALWYDAGIGSYAYWPVNGVNRVVDGAGVWYQTNAAYYFNGMLQVDAASTEPLCFVPAAQRLISGEALTILSEAKFTAASELESPQLYGKGAITVFMDDFGVCRYYGIRKDAAGGTNRWVRLAGAEPDTNRMVAVSVSLKRESGVSLIRYAVDGTALKSDGDEWMESVMDGDTVSPCYAGTGLVRALSAEVDCPVCLLALPPALEHMSVASVSVGGVELEPQGGVYSVARGAVVTVKLAVDNGYTVSDSSMVLTVGSDTVLGVGDFPVAMRADGLRINEVMASNKSTLATAGGVTGLDFVEIRNAGSTAVDLAGWRITDDPTKKVSKWKEIEGPAVVPAGGYAIIWCDPDFTGWDARDAHAALAFSAAGEAVGLAHPDGTIVSQFTFGQQFDDVSFGYGRLTRTLLSDADEAEWRVGGGEWSAVKGPVGMSASASGFRVVSYQMRTDETYSSVSSLDVAMAMLANPAYWGAVFTNECETIAFQNNDNGRNEFPPYGSFPGVSGDNFVVVVTGAINIPEPGWWTFSVGSDDGFSCRIRDRESDYDYYFEHRGGRGYNHNPEDRGQFNFTRAGAYDVELVYFENGGGASLDFSVAQGSKRWATDRADFRLVGSAESRVLHDGAFSAKIGADVSSAMVGRNAQLQWRGSFVMPSAPAEGEAFRLRIRYADGFTARMNGVEFASVPAAGPRPALDALEYAYFDIPAAAVHEGVNTLEVTGYNDSAADTEFFLSPEVQWTMAGEQLLHFSAPTPLVANGVDGRRPITRSVTFSEPHGWKTGAFDLTMSCPDDPGASIYYTTDGTSPTAYSSRYTGPVRVSSTTVFRAAAVDVDSIFQLDCSASYFFVEDVVRQDEKAPPGFPESLAVNNQKMRYGMAQNVVDGADGARLRNGFTNSICTISLVIDLDNLFDPGHGIYVNAQGDGRAWERPTMVEQIDPVNGAVNEFSVPAGLRIRGAYSRGSDKAKHSLRLFFRSDYGMSKLNFPLFGDEGASVFKVVDLRTAQNFSWSNENNTSDPFVHEVFSRDSQRDMGEPYNRSRHYNLFINGVYWGLYQTEERVSQDNEEEYFGDKAENYSVVRTSQPGYNTGVVDGDPSTWSNLWHMAVIEGFEGEYYDNYKRAMGLNPDGTRNPAYPIYLDPRSLIAYMLCSHYTGDTDCPSMSGGDRGNNIIACCNPYDTCLKPGFQFYRHDTEHSIEGDGKNQDTTLLGSEAYTYWTKIDGVNVLTNRYDDARRFTSFNPSELHYRLTKNPEYRMAVADFFYAQCLRQGGAFTLPEASARFMRRMAEIDDAIVCESARWGHNDNEEREPGFTSFLFRSTWLNACRGRLNFITNRVPYLTRQYRNRGWYPSFDVPVATDAGGVAVTNGQPFAVGAELRFNTHGGDVYYTLDGSDPRLEGGAANPAAVRYTGAELPAGDVSAFARGSEWRYFDWGSQPADDGAGRAWNQPGFDDSGWASGAGAFGFKNNVSFGTALSRFINHGTSGTQVTTYYLRKTFSLPAEAAGSVRVKGVVYVDDGYVMYLNGEEIGRSANLPAGAISYATYTTNYIDPSETAYDFEIPAGLLRAGENVLAVEVHQCNATSSDVAWDCSLSYVRAAASREGAFIPVTGDNTVTFRELRSGEWSAIDTVTVRGEDPGAAANAAFLRFAEFNGLPPLGDGDTGEFIVLTNLSADATLDLAGVGVMVKKEADPASAAKCAFTIASGTIPPAGSIRLDQADYAAAGWSKITNNKVDLYLIARDGETFIQTSHAEQKNFPTVYGAGGPGGGASLVATAFGAETGKGDWRASYELPVAASGAAAVNTAIVADSAIGAWLDALTRTNGAARADLASFTGDVRQLRDLYLVGYDALPSDRPVRIAVSAIGFDADGNVKLDGALTVGAEPWPGRVNGVIKVYRYETLGSDPDVIVLGERSFPVKDVTGDESGVYRFFKIVLE